METDAHHLQRYASVTQLLLPSRQAEAVHTDSLFLQLVFFSGFSKLCKVDLLERTDREADMMCADRRRTVKNPSPRCVITLLRCLIKVR